MKRTLSFILTFCILVSSLGILTVGASAYPEDFDACLKAISKENENTVTKVTDTDGIIHTVKGVIDARALDALPISDLVASYSIYRGDTLLMSAELKRIDTSSRDAKNSSGSGGSVYADGLTPASGGYYSVRFTVSEEESTEAFITGLTASNVETIKAAVLESASSGEAVLVDDLDFIDAEKSAVTDSDDNHCWAAQTSNLLWYTGWAEAANERYDLSGTKGSFSSPDDVFKLYYDNYSYSGYFGYYALAMFFTGNNPAQGSVSGVQVGENYGKIGGYFPEYPITTVAKQITLLDDHTKLVDVLDNLENGWGVGLNVIWNMFGVNDTSGHALTLWGYVCDKDFAKYDYGYLKSIIISDSDNYDYNYASPGTARVDFPNILTVVDVEEWYGKGDGYDTWAFSADDCYGSYLGQYYGVISEAELLVPYSEDIERPEKDPAATLDPLNYPDLVANSLNFDTDFTDPSYMNGLYFRDQTIYIRPIVSNIGLGIDDVTCRYSLDITDESGKTVYSSGIIEDVDKATLDWEYWWIYDNPVVLEGFAPGNYTVTVTVNPDRAIREAYYYNNSISRPLIIVDRDSDDVGRVGLIQGSFTGGEADVDFSYSLNKNLGENIAVYLYERAYKDGKWGDYTFYGKYYELPSKAVVSSDMKKVQFKFIVYDLDLPEKPADVFYSDEAALLYNRLQLELDVSNTGTYSIVRSEDKHLAEGEYFAVKVNNVSTSSIAVDYDLYFIVQNNDGETVIAEFDGQSLKYNRSSRVVKINSWDEDLEGVYTVIAYVDAGDASDEIDIGTIGISSDRVEVLNDNKGNMYSLEYHVSDGEAVIDGYSGSPVDVVIPETIAGYPVTAIGTSAFTYCGSLEKVRFPDTVKTISAYSFYGADALKEVVIGKGVSSIAQSAFRANPSLEQFTVDEDNESYSSRSGMLFTKDRETLIKCPQNYYASTIIFTSPTKNVASLAFEDCVFGTVMFAEGLETLSDNAFNHCEYLTRVVLPQTVSSIGKNAFLNCYNLSVIDFCGSEKDWNEIKIAAPNGKLLSIAVNFGFDPCENGHCYSDDYTVDVKATYLMPGSESRHCVFCDDRTDEREIPMIGYDGIGDVNHDDSLDMKDVLYIRKYIAGIVGENELDSERADINLDGDVDMKDVLLLRLILAGVK